MRKPKTIIIAMLMVNSAQAQVSIAPEAGFQMVSMKTKDYSTPFPVPKLAYKPSFRAGINVALEISRIVSVQGGLFYAPKGFKATLNGNTFNRANLHYIDLPVYINFNILNKKGNRLFAGAGPYLSYCMSGKSKLDLAVLSPPLTGIEEYQLRVGNNTTTDDIKPLDLGANANLGFISSTGLYIRAQYSIGLSNTVPGGDQNNSLKNRAFGVSIGYRIKL